MKTRYAIDLVQSRRKVFSVDYSTVLDEANIVKIFSSGYSRVPVYDGSVTAIRGVLMTRQLIVVEAADNCPVSHLPLHIPHCVAPDTNLVDLINLFQGSSGDRHARSPCCHLALVCASPDLGNAALSQNEPLPEGAGYVGIITFEDVLEALIQEQIYDEMDAAGRSTREVPSDDITGDDEGNHYELV